MKSKRNKCEQQWLDDHATTSTRAMFHEKACNYLGLPLGVTIEDVYAHEKGSQAIPIEDSKAIASEGKPFKVKKTLGEGHANRNIPIFGIICRIRSCSKARHALDSTETKGL